ncbi:MAG TPA: 50S ribosomal protein L4 [Thermoanaerobaculia bacterium]|nr:50S ribosomal protein L4 [Thermoanaerobaculia bacterium]HUM30639.1 50S ribosomal protein L4 [Thermoanaerobaculia bacterium]HXK68953.1 50S ribosomal protein L4 [Thermoanaerobaculia bacterium]
MVKVTVHNWDFEPVEELELPEEIFSVPLRRHLLWEYIRVYRANQRQGTASTKTRAEVAGSGKKLWRQKGTGRARMGSIRSPLWRKGGTVHGPRPRDYSLKMNKKQKRLALRMALSQRFRDNDLIVLDTLELNEHKTKELRNRMNKLSVQSGVLFVDSIADNRNLFLASRNLPKVDFVHVDTLNTYDVVGHRKVIFSKPAIQKVTEVLKP